MIDTIDLQETRKTITSQHNDGSGEEAQVQGLQKLLSPQGTLGLFINRTGAAGSPEAGREMATRTGASRCHQPGDRGNGEQAQPPTATVTATAAANRCHQRPAAAHDSRTIHANWGICPA